MVLEAVFPPADRNKHSEVMAKREIRRGSIERVREIYKETMDRVRKGKEISKEFSTELGLRLGCPLRPLIFSVFFAETEEKFNRRIEGGLVVGGTRVWSLAFANVIVLLAREEEVADESDKEI